MLFNTTGALFSLVQFVAFFGPLIGIILGFDTINRERGDGTLIKIVSQPIYRDSVINGKFLAGVATISIILISILAVISGLGLIILGIVSFTSHSGLACQSSSQSFSEASLLRPWQQLPYGYSYLSSFPWGPMYWRIRSHR